MAHGVRQLHGGNGLPRGDAPHCRVALGGGAQQLGPPVGGVGKGQGEPGLHQHVGGPLHALAGEAHGTTDARHRERGAQHRAQHLPAGGREPHRPGQLLGEREELTVQAEHGEGHVTEQDRGVGHAADVIETA